jgi:hypothetical protein
MTPKRRATYIRRYPCSPGPFVALVTSEDMLADELRRLKFRENIPFLRSEAADATTHFLVNRGNTTALVCLGNTEGRTKAEVIGLLAHEAVHIMQDYFESIGESTPSKEVQAYAVQHYTQLLFHEWEKTK